MNILQTIADALRPVQPVRYETSTVALARKLEPYITRQIHLVIDCMDLTGVQMGKIPPLSPLEEMTKNERCQHCGVGEQKNRSRCKACGAPL